MAGKAVRYVNKSLNLLGCQVAYQKRMASVVGGARGSGVRQREAVLTAAPPPPPTACPRGLAVPPHGALCRPSEARLSLSRGWEGPPCPDVAGWPDGHSALRRSSDSVGRPPRPDGGLRPETVLKPLGAAGQRLGGEARGRAGVLWRTRPPRRRTHCHGAGWAVLCAGLQVQDVCFTWLTKSVARSGSRL